MKRVVSRRIFRAWFCRVKIFEALNRPLSLFFGDLQSDRNRHASIIPLKRALIEEHRIEPICLQERQVKGCVDLICECANGRHGVHIQRNGAELLLAGATVANTGNGFINSNLVIAMGSGWLQRSVRPVQRPVASIVVADSKAFLTRFSSRSC